MSLLPLLGLAGLMGLVAAWLAGLLLVFPARLPGGKELPWLRGPVASSSARIAAYAEDRLVSGLPEPSRIFENLGPDRYRREIFRSLRSQTDAHVDEVMARRNARAWSALSSYARQRVYAHVHRRLPFVVDNFVENVHRDLDVIIRPGHLVRAYFTADPDAASRLFHSAFAADLRACLPAAVLAGTTAGWLVSHMAAGPWALAWVTGAAALAGALLTPVWLLYPRRKVTVWPFLIQGTVYRRRRRYLRLLAVRIANEALSWRTISSEFLRGGQAERVHMIMRREVAGILDTALFKATLQILVGPEAVVEVKRSALEKAMDLLAATPMSPALRESFRVEVERTLLHAAEADADEEAYERLWITTLDASWRYLAPALAAAGFLLGALLAQVLPALST